MSTVVIVTTCRRCRHTILAAFAEGLWTKVDPAGLDRAGELAALLQGRWTYTLTGHELVHRDAGRITGGHLTGPVLADHACPDIAQSH